MRLSRIRVENFRNFSSLDIAVSGNVVVVGENRVGKSNLLYALRLLLDPTLPDSSRELVLADFWEGLAARDADTKIVISVEITGFEDNLDVLALLTDYRLAANPCANPHTEVVESLRWVRELLASGSARRPGGSLRMWMTPTVSFWAASPLPWWRSSPKSWMRY
jgi:predicted ATP-dependent endonuclease of OLD family